MNYNELIFININIILKKNTPNLQNIFNDCHFKYSRILDNFYLQYFIFFSIRIGH